MTSLADHRRQACWSLTSSTRRLRFQFRGAVVARFRARGLSLVMMAVAAAQIGLAVYADATAQDLPLRVTVVFVTGWLVAAALFDRAAREGRV